MSSRNTLVRTANRIYAALVAAVGRLDKSLSPRDTIRRLQNHSFTLSDTIYLFHIALATFWITLMQSPGFPLKLLIPVLYAIALLIPFTSQFFVPATPVFAWLLTYYSSRFIPDDKRPSVSVAVLPTLESVLYGANVSDILTRFTHPVLDVIAWIPYGVGHFTFPFVVAIFIWLFRPKQVLHLWARVFGYLNLVGVIVQILFPCAAPWYEVIFGLTPADYSMLGSPGGLLRIDNIFHSHGYTVAFSHAPVVFGAFPSLHSACATIEALFLSHFFPQTTKYVWAYAGTLYWSTMYLTHHYLIDVVGGSCLAIAFFYVFLPDEFKGPAATAGPNGFPGSNGTGRLSKYEIYDLEAPRPRRGGGGMDGTDYELSSDVSSPHASDEEDNIAYRSPAPETPRSSMPLIGNERKKPRTQAPRRSHKHTASIASLIRADDRVEEGWSPIGTGSFMFPPTPTQNGTPKAP
ncbi:PAP2-domain-containing protein [Dentipellis sp. KUC8613]|nr:PAP2-domain-containing protein [Dentipellis sp. KUC8613]